jgi:hypothetical protein
MSIKVELVCDNHCSYNQKMFFDDGTETFQCVLDAAEKDGWRISKISDKERNKLVKKNHSIFEIGMAIWNTVCPECVKEGK